eukprot:gene9180-1268_t
MNSISFSLDTSKPFKVKETIEGKLCICLNRPAEIIQTNLKILGFEKVNHQTNIFLKQIHETKKTKSWDNRTNSLTNKIHKIFGLKDERNQQQQTGLIEYPFQILLPNLLPSTVESPYGKIKYTIIARVWLKSENGRKICLQTEIKLPIKGQLIHEQFINQRIPIRISGKKSFLFSPKSKIFKTGDLITGQFQFFNEIQREVLNIHLSFRQKYWWFETEGEFGGGSWRTEEIIISKLNFSSFIKNYKFTLITPTYLPETISNKFIQKSSTGKLLQISYRVKMKIDFKYALPLRISIPVIIIKNIQEDISKLASAPIFEEEVPEETIVDL